MTVRKSIYHYLFIPKKRRTETRSGYFFPGVHLSNLKKAFPKKLYIRHVFRFKDIDNK